MAITRIQQIISDADPQYGVAVAGQLVPLQSDKFFVCAAFLATDDGSIPQGNGGVNLDAFHPYSSREVLGRVSSTFVDSFFFVTYGVLVEAHAYYSPTGIASNQEIGLQWDNGTYPNVSAALGWAAEYTGMAAVGSVLDKSHAASGDSVTTADTGSTAATTQATELWLNIFTAANTGISPPTFSALSGSFSLADHFETNSWNPVVGLGIGERIVSATGTAGGTATISQSVHQHGLALALKGAAAAASNTGNFFRLFK